MNIQSTPFGLGSHVMGLLWSLDETSISRFPLRGISSSMVREADLCIFLSHF